MSFQLLSKASAHPTEELLEEYSFGRVGEPELTALEEHLLLCVPCQEKLQEIEDYIALMKTATREWERNPDAFRAASGSELPISTRFAIPRISGATLLTAGFAALVIAAVTANVAPPWRSQPLPAATVKLMAMRGGGLTGEYPDGLAQAPSGRPLDLTIDGANLPPLAGYRLQIVDASGHEIWSGPAVVTAAMLRAHVSRAPRSGVYWVRLYTSDGELLREFGMRLT